MKALYALKVGGKMIGKVVSTKEGTKVFYHTQVAESPHGSSLGKSLRGLDAKAVEWLRERAVQEIWHWDRHAGRLYKVDITVFMRKAITSVDPNTARKRLVLPEQHWKVATKRVDPVPSKVWTDKLVMVP